MISCMVCLYLDDMGALPNVQSWWEFGAEEDEVKIWKKLARAGT